MSDAFYMKIRLKRLFYGIGLFLLALITLPKFLYQCIFFKKYRRSWKQRFGFDVAENIPQDKINIWVHAVSVGEAKAIIPLIQKMHNDSIHWIFSSTTETGFDEVKRSLNVPHTQLYMPLDFNWIIRPLMRRVNPKLILISETDLWLNFLSAAKEQGGQIALVNGKISERSANRLQKVPFFAEPLLSMIDTFCVQDAHYADRFKSLGVPEEKITITGNLKWDQTIRPLRDPVAFRRQWGIQPDDRVLVLGSTHPGEEKLVLEQLLPIIQKRPNWKLLVVPRHPERFAAVKQLTEQMQSDQIVLINRMGILTDCYQIADLVILGGSFVPGIGGHNILEPCQVGVGVFFGPFMHNQEEMVKLVLGAKAGAQVDISHIGVAIEEAISHDGDLGSAGLKLASKLVGASERTIRCLDVESLFRRSSAADSVKAQTSNR